MRLAVHSHAHFVDTSISKGNSGISIVKELVNGLTLLKTGKRTVLPQDRGNIGNRSKKTLMSAAKCSVAKLKAILQDLPEFIEITLRGACHINKVDGHNALIETAVEFVGTVRVLLFLLNGKEGAASHAGVYIAVLQLAHDLSGNVVRNHTLGGTFGSNLSEVPVLGILVDVVLIQNVDQLRESRSDPCAALILNALHTLLHYLFNDQSQIITGTSLRNLVQIHENSHKRSLSVTGHKSDQLILDGLDTALDLVLQSALGNLADDLLVHRLTAFLTLLDHFIADLLTADINERS